MILAAGPVGPSGSLWGFRLMTFTGAKGHASFGASGPLFGCLAVPAAAARWCIRVEPSLERRSFVVACRGPRQVVIDAWRVDVPWRRGQPVSELLGASPGLRLVDFDETGLSGWLSDWVGGLRELLGPERVETDLRRFGSWYLDLAGLVPYFGGLDRLSEAVLSVVEALWEPRLAVSAHSKFAAGCGVLLPDSFWAERPWYVFQPDGDLAVVSGLSLDVLNLGVASRRRADALGLRTIGDVAALGEGSSAELLGGAGLKLFRLITGRLPDPVIGDRVEELLSESVQFPYPVADRDGIIAGIELLAGRFWPSLGRGPLLGRLPGHVAVRCLLDGGSHWDYSRDLSHGGNGGAGELAASLRWGIEGSGWPDGPVLEIAVTLSGLSVEKVEQSRLWDRGTVVSGGRKPGRGRLVALSPESAIPERRWALAPDMDALGLPEPARVRVTGKGGVPAAVHRSGRWVSVAQVLDCWEVDVEWWSGSPVRRRYWRVLLDTDRVVTLYDDLESRVQGDAGWYRQDY